MSTTAKVPTTVVVCPTCSTKNRVPAAAGGAPRCGKCKHPLPWMVDTSDADFTRVADESALPVLVDIWAPWCGPCRMVTPALEQLAAEFAGRIKLVKVNADEAPEVTRRFEVQAIPTLILLHRGRVIVKQVGAAPARVLRQWLIEHLPAEESGSTGAQPPSSGEDVP